MILNDKLNSCFLTLIGEDYLKKNSTYQLSYSDIIAEKKETILIIFYASSIYR